MNHWVFIEYLLLSVGFWCWSSRKEPVPAFKVSTLCGKKLDRNKAVCYRECGMVNKQSRCLQHGAEGSWDKGLLGKDVSEISGET